MKEIYETFYTVHLKKPLKGSIIDDEFIGSLEEAGPSVRFRLKDTTATIIVQYEDIEWMAPTNKI